MLNSEKLIKRIRQLKNKYLHFFEVVSNDKYTRLFWSLKQDYLKAIDYCDYYLEGSINLKTFLQIFGKSYFAGELSCLVEFIRADNKYIPDIIAIQKRFRLNEVKKQVLSRRVELTRKVKPIRQRRSPRYLKDYVQ